jgi:hypothetical protein
MAKYYSVLFQDMTLCMLVDWDRIKVTFASVYGGSSLARKVGIQPTGYRM